VVGAGAALSPGARAGVGVGALPAVEPPQPASSVAASRTPGLARRGDRNGVSSGII
jgi:hypothetical protein